MCRQRRVIVIAQLITKLIIDVAVSVTENFELDRAAVNFMPDQTMGGNSLVVCVHVGGASGVPRLLHMHDVIETALAFCSLSCDNPISLFTVGIIRDRARARSREKTDIH